MILKEPYVRINGMLASLMLLIFSYCFFYPELASQGLTIPSSCEGMPELYCRSRGLSRAFYQIMHSNFEKAAALNKYSMSIFIFFMSQFFARLILTTLYIRTKSNRLIVLDSIFSAAYFIYVFFPLTFLYYWLWGK